MKKLLIYLAAIMSLLMASVSGVAAATTNQAQLPVAQVNFIGVYPSQTGGLDVQEIFQLTNSTKQTLTGGSLVDPNGKQKTGWFIPLPQGFQNLSVQQGLSKGDYAVVKDGFQVYKPVKPGTAEIGIVYSLSSNAPVTFTKKFPFTTNALLIDVPKNSFTIAGKGLQQMQTLTDQGVEYVRYVYNGAFQLGDQIDITVNPATATAAGANSADNKVAAGYNVPWHPDGHVAFFTSEPLSYTNPHIWAAYLFIMLFLAIAAVFLFYRLRMNKIPGVDDVAEDEEDFDPFLALKTKQDLLLERIKALDSQFKQGSIPEEEYHATREKYKESLVRVKIQLKELT